MAVQFPATLVKRRQMRTTAHGATVSNPKVETWCAVKAGAAASSGFIWNAFRWWSHHVENGYVPHAMP